MPKVWTLEQRGISRPGPASSRSRTGQAEQASARVPWRRGPRGRARSRPAGDAKDVLWLSGTASGHLSLCLMPAGGKVTVFGPHPMLAITIEALTSEGGDDIHLHAAGQGVWVARMAAELGASPILCGFIGGETGTVLRPLLEQMDGRDAPGRDRRGERQLRPRPPQRRARAGRPERLDAALPPRDRRALLDHRRRRARLATCWRSAGPIPARRCRWRSTATSSPTSRRTARRSSSTSRRPRLDSALEGGPDLVKINDWELAGYIEGPVDTEERMRAAAQRLLDAGAGAVIITRAEEPAMVVRGDEAWELVPPRFERGSREGCGDSMMGGLAACMAAGLRVGGDAAHRRRRRRRQLPPPRPRQRLARR